MKFEKVLDKACRGYSFYYLTAYDNWCCSFLKMYSITAMITNNYSVRYYVGLDEDSPWLKLRDVRYCTFCGEEFKIVT